MGNGASMGWIGWMPLSTGGTDWQAVMLRKTSPIGKMFLLKISLTIDLAFILDSLHGTSFPLSTQKEWGQGGEVRKDWIQTGLPSYSWQ
jgi:hypothetical protein